MRRVKDDDSVIQVVGNPEVARRIKHEVGEIRRRSGIADVRLSGVVVYGRGRSAWVWLGRARVFDDPVVQETALSRVQIAGCVKGNTYVIRIVQCEDEGLRNGLRGLRQVIRYFEYALRVGRAVR